MSQKVTIYSIARELGLHASTVSRAFSRPHMVRPEVRERVLAKAAELQYEPNRLARGLITGRTGMVGVLIPDIENPYFPPLVRSVQRSVAGIGLNVLLMDSERDPRAEPSFIRRVRSQVDGMIVASPRSATVSLMEAAHGLPLVLVNRRITGAASVIIDNTPALRESAAMLRTAGHRTFALLRGPSRSWAAEQRTRAVREWASATPDVSLSEVGPIEAVFEGGFAAAAEVLASGATAVLTFDDVMASGLVAGLLHLGLTVPHDVSVVGCDDVLLARTLSPPLTTIRAPFPALGDAVAAALESLLAGTEPVAATLHGELVVRASTGPVPVRR